jgi:hypothetical protein
VVIGTELFLFRLLPKCSDTSAIRPRSIITICEWHHFSGYGTAVFEVEDTMRRLSHRTAIQKKLTPMTFLGPVTLWSQLEDRQLGMSFRNIIQFSPEMIEQIRGAPLFEDQKVFWLKKAVGALQLYLLLRDRCAQDDLKGKEHGWIPVHGPSSLESQLGWVHRPARREVRRRIAEWIKLLRASVWPDCPGELHQGATTIGDLRSLIAHLFRRRSHAVRPMAARCDSTSSV